MLNGRKGRLSLDFDLNVGELQSFNAMSGLIVCADVPKKEADVINLVVRKIIFRVVRLNLIQLYVAISNNDTNINKKF